MGDDGEQRVLHLLRVAQQAHVPHIGDHVGCVAIFVVRRRVVIRHTHLHPIGALSVTLDVQTTICRRIDQRAGGVTHAHPLLVPQVQHIVAVTADGIHRYDTGHSRQRSIPGTDGTISVQDHYPVPTVLDDGVQPVAFLIHLLIQTGILHCDSSLVSEIGQYLPVIGRETHAP